MDTELLFKTFVQRFKPAVIFDIGSFDGRHSLTFNQVSPETIIYAFEPNPNNFENLKKIAQELRTKIIPVNKAVLDKSKIMDFHLEQSNKKSPLGSAFERVNKSDNFRKVKVECISLKDFIEQQNLSKNKYFLWLDAEGSSYEVLTGLNRYLNNVQLMHFEFEEKQIWEKQVTKEKIIEYLIDNNFKVLAECKNRFYDNQGDILAINSNFLNLNKKIVNFILIHYPFIKLINKINKFID